MSKILVTGGAGFIGSTLVDQLITQGHKVTVVDNLVSGCREYINQKADFWEMDISDPELVARLREAGFELVYHLAAQIDVRKSVADPAFDTQVNILGGLNVLEAARQGGVSKVIMASTGGAIYGETDELPTSENAPTYPLSPYGINKLALEKYLNYYYQVYGLNYTVLRFANVYGPRQYKGGEAGVVAIFTEAMASDKACTLYGDGKQTRDFVYVDDVVNAFIVASKIDCRGEINISTAKETDMWEMIMAIEEAAGKKLKIELAPARAGEQRRSVLLNRRALETLDWSPRVDFPEGIKRTYDWVKETQK
ncbi:UDP-glucose 4-epimerase [Candidatus Falkowbacteria bacterium HGW-Falkowbacteria-2]|uniref:UDP-glucose 4-epimerase n=1 Tax=Candidatus Falkowbacteria bacterium HGW-Falkowbacteria-2 TaxID=2013769 RepID=A0A2N2E0F4_9BACT|nr:MAG: UDP-glucose 4-epimerase [Candidatus Falkowbacteria bacterium HGW-Falkowbacteria-2]